MQARFAGRPIRFAGKSILGLLLCFACAAFAGERGQPLVDVYDSQEIGGGHINESVHELPDGRIAVANVGGLLLFDGARWRMYNHPQMRGGVRRLAPTPDGRIYVGFDADIGYFQDDGSGRYQWHSLREGLNESDRGFVSVYRCEYDPERQGVWFVTDKRLIFISLSGAAQAYPSSGVFSFGGRVGADFWVQDTVAGLQRVSAFNRLTLEPVPQRESLIEGRYLRSVVADPQGWKIALADGRLFSYDGREFRPWAQALWKMLEPSHLFSILRLRDGRFVIASGELEPLLLSADGELLERYGRADGVPAHETKGMLEDRLGGLWLAQNLTLVRIDLARGLTRLGEAQGLPSATALARWRGQVFATSGSGLYRLNAETGPGGGRFERVLPLMRNANALAVIDDRDLLVGSQGVMAVSIDVGGNLQSRVVHFLPKLANLQGSRFVTGRAWGAHSGGLLKIDRNGEEFAVTPVTDINWPVFVVAEESADVLWISDRAGGLWRISVSGQRSPERISEGVPPGPVRIYPQSGEGVWFATSAGVRVYDAEARLLRVAPGIPEELQSGRIFSLAEDTDHNLWIRADALTDVAWRDPAGNYAWDRQLFNSVSNKPTIFGFVRERSIVWVLRADGLLRIDLDSRHALPPAIAPLLTHADDLGARLPLALDALAALPAEVRNLRLGFALPNPFRVDQNQYRSRLGGIDPDWTEWTRESTRDFTNLPDGEFRFDLQARDSFARVSSLPPVLLSIAPPWSRSTPAHALYLTGALLLLWWSGWIGSRWRQRALLARQRELEAQVAARTHELQDKNQQLAEQAERLAEVDRLKTRFFINVGHEFRTPLTLVLGPIDDLLRDARERLSARAREQLEMANRNARRVLDLIVELLDVNRFEHGQMRMRSLSTELSALLLRVVADNRELVERHGHALRLDLPPDTRLQASVDPTMLERALSNLIGNAAKYMARGGVIELAARATGGTIEITVRDGGRGISAAALPHVFDRFFQAEGGDRASGYGIGLALVREIVEGHQGSISVESTLGVGSCFRIRLPVAEMGGAAEPGTSEAAAAEQAPLYQSETTAEEQAPRKIASDAALVPTRHRQRILVVDDHDDLRARVRTLLAERFEVIEANDGPSAWKAARDQLPDLIVCDVMMPGFDGIELTRRVRADADTAAIGLLLLTAKVGSEHAVAGLTAGANDYLSKPFDSSELNARVDAILFHAQRLRLRLAREASPEVAPIVVEETADQRWRRRLDEQINAHLDDPEFSVELLAHGMHADRSQLFRKCKELLGVSPSEYLRDTRLKRAQQMLQQSAGNISEIAYAVGFESLSSFTRAFKARFGVAPSQLTKLAG